MTRSKLHNFDLSPTWGRQTNDIGVNVNPLHAIAVPPVDNNDDDDDNDDNDDDYDAAVDDNDYDDGDESSDSAEGNNHRSTDHRSNEVEKFHRFPAESSSVDRRRRLGFNLNSPSPPPSPAAGDIDQISATREKLTMEYRTEVKKMQKSILKNNISGNKISPIKGKLVSSPSPSPPPPPPPPLPAKIRRKDGADGGSDSRSDNKSTRGRRNLEKKEERPKFTIELSREEIDEDYIVLTGKRPPRKPNEQSKSVQMKLNTVFPGSQLHKVDRKRYKVKKNGKI